ncbi:thermonuclease family protein [Bacillus sp. EB106-08-02-XG196]|uniref:thermonuclease family protein n=1 Tax=Bacillus sp. EB106-08-02-XG196 TaxID=2737049 RepID=UPI0015C4C476|nr:thermonuclease family protein [Bacillus sp. EB106-08-02-XG196]NWQ43332.1 thermonuclease family protein [Bacillus sp. EB106-08-02-XG196]
MRKETRGIAMIAAAACLAFYSYPIEKEEHVVENALPVTENQVRKVPIRLVEIIDGDTIRGMVNGKLETVRYLLIDTPESKNPKTCVQFYAKEAFLRNQELANSGEITIELEEGNTRDAYGRLLAYVYVDGESIQGTLLREGYARVAYIMNPPYKYLEHLRKEENIAIRKNINIWSRLNFVSNRGFNGCLYNPQM